MRPQRLSILGVGLLGGSIGLAVKSVVNTYHVAGYGHKPSTLQDALRMGALDEAYDDPRAAVRGADLVILCTPVGLLCEMLDTIVPALEPGAIVTDVGSTKRSVVAHAGRIPRLRFVGSHPMAGSENRGVQFAQADLYKNALCLTTPDVETDADALVRVERFWESLGMRIRRMSPDEHDRTLADVSHLPHAVAAALVAMQGEAGFDVAGKGFLDMTRIAGGDGGLWRDIFLDNRDNLRDSVRRLHQTLQALLTNLEPGNEEALRAWLDGAARRRQEALDRRLRDTG